MIVLHPLYLFYELFIDIETLKKIDSKTNKESKNQAELELLYAYFAKLTHNFAVWFNFSLYIIILNLVH